MISYIYSASIGRAGRTAISQPERGHAYLMFCDEQGRSAVPDPWVPVEVATRFGHDPGLQARMIKLMPHLHLPDHDFSLWIDADIEVSPAFLLPNLIARLMSDMDIALFRHPHRNCIYEEAWHAITQRKEDSSRIYRQTARYAAHDFPPNMGLYGTAAILRRNSPKMMAFDEIWWAEVCQGSENDRISFVPLAIKHGLRIALLPGEIGANPFFFPRS